MHVTYKRTEARTRSRTGLRRGSTFALTLVAGLYIAACGESSAGPNVASTGTSSATVTAAKPTVSVRDRTLAYSRCMRAHDLPEFPDPNSNGQIALNATPRNGLSPDSARMKAAMRACRSLQPTTSPGQATADFAKTLKFAKCMREHGVPSFPDPPAPGSAPATQSSQAGGENAQSQLDPSSPAFKSGMQACRTYLPGGADVGVSSGGGDGA